MLADSRDGLSLASVANLHENVRTPQRKMVMGKPSNSELPDLKSILVSYAMVCEQRLRRLIRVFVCRLCDVYILRKTNEGYLETVPSLTFNTIKTKLIMHAFHSSIYLQSKGSAVSQW